MVYLALQPTPERARWRESDEFRKTGSYDRDHYIFGRTSASRKTWYKASNLKKYTLKKGSWLTPVLLNFEPRQNHHTSTNVSVLPRDHEHPLKVTKILDAIKIDRVDDGNSVNCFESPIQAILNWCSSTVLGKLQTKPLRPRLSKKMNPLCCSKHKYRLEWLIYRTVWSTRYRGQYEGTKKDLWRIIRTLGQNSWTI